MVGSAPNPRQADDVGRLVAIDLPAGAAVEALRSVWDEGDAVLMIDQRLPPPGRRQVLEAMAPAAIVDGSTGPTGRRLLGVESEPTEDGDALVVTTSGTTGDPKGVVLTHDAVASHARAVHRRLEVDPTTDHWLACLPLAHVGGLGVVTRALTTGTALTVHDGFDAGRVTAAGSGANRCTLVSLVPTALGRTATDRYRWVVLGGSADPADRPTNVIRTYGLTESGGGVVYDGHPLDGVDVRIVDNEIWLRGPMLIRSYRNGTDPKDAHGWLPTGDLGRWDLDDALIVDGRRDDVIVTGGENVWPPAVEAALSMHPSVADVAVGGRADDEWGQRVVAFVVARSGTEPPTLAQLRDLAKQSLPRFAAPRELILVDTVPRTALGKVRRGLLGPEDIET